MFKKIIHYIKHGIWQKSEDEYRTRKQRWAVRQFKILLYAARGFGEHDLIVRSASLTFYTLMSIVPVAALIFGMIKGFGMETNLHEYLVDRFPQYTVIIDNVLHFANNMLARTRGGVVASFGFVVLIWAVMRVFGNIESAFNNIWEVKKSRSIARKFSDYMSVIFVTPILWIIANGIGLFIRNKLSTIGWVPWDLLYGLASLVLLWLMFAFLYLVMPNTKVKIRNALTAGIIAGTAFSIFQVAYVYIQSQLTSYNAIYGSFAAVPLFLIWLQTSWQIVLTGAELSFAYQNIGSYEQERESLHISYDDRRKITLAAMLLIVRHYVQNKGPVTSEMVSNALNMPLRIVRDVIFNLENAGLLLVVKMPHDDKSNYYIPAKDVNRLTLYDVIDAVEHYGPSRITFVDTSEMHAVTAFVDRLRTELKDSPEDVPLVDII